MSKGIIKGNVCIELHNHKTGLRDRIEGKNNITPFIQRMINFNCINNSAIEVYVTPLVSKTIGGLILIDKYMNNGDIFIPGDSKIIGTGFQGFNTESEYIGTYNTAESGIDETGKVYTHVWDFNTSQANGIIKSLGLIHTKGGEVSTSICGLNSRSFSSGLQIIYVDETNNDVYFTTVTSASAPIYKIHYTFFELMLQYTSEGVPISSTNAINTGKTIDTNSNAFTYGHDGYIYKLQSATSNSLILKKYKVSDLSFDEQSNVTFTFPSTPGNNRYALNLSVGRVYVYSSNYEYIYMLNVNNSTVTTIDNPIKQLVPSQTSSSTLAPAMVCTPNGDCYSGTHSNVNIPGVGNRYIIYRINTSGISQVDYTSNVSSFTNAFYTASASSSQLKVTPKGLLLSCTTSASYVYPFSKGLCTNFNLPEDIEKTVAKSMKVIYTLTQP